MARDSRNDWGEYGGKPGSIQKEEDGHVELTPAEEARVMRTYGIRNSAAATTDPAEVEVPTGVDADGEVWEDEERLTRRRMIEESRRRLNGRVI